MKTSAADMSPSSPAHWSGPGARARRDFSWRGLLWALIFPAKRHHISVTVPGVFLIALAMGIGTAAYNTASNILFLTLSLLLACLLLSGLLSWFNLRGVSWRLRSPGSWRAGHETMITVEVRNAKSWLPTYGLWFDLKAYLPLQGGDLQHGKVKEALAAIESATTRSRLVLRDRIEPGSGVQLDWVHKPGRRGEAVLELEGVGSFYPFGFLRKTVGTGLRQPVLVWPAQVDYQWHASAAASAVGAGRRTVRAGAGEDLLALRRYQAGDSHRLIHWKASARLGQMMVRQFAAESIDAFSLHLEPTSGLWTRPEQFELLCSFAATLAEDLFAAGRLRGVSINEAWIETRRLRDVEAVLDALARVTPVALTAADFGPGALMRQSHAHEGQKPRGEGIPPARRAAVARNVITFAPDGARGVVALIDGVPIATA